MTFECPVASLGMVTLKHWQGSVRPEGLAYALMAVNEAAWHIDRMQCIECAPSTLSLIGSKSIDEAHEFHQILAASRGNWHYQSVMGVDHALPYQKPGLCARLIVEHLRP